MEEESKAVQEVAKTAGKAIDAAREAGGFIARFVSGSLAEGMGIFEDRLRYMRWERQVRLMRRAEELIHDCGLPGPTRPVPLKIAIPLLQAATLEEDDALQDRWAALLVNAANASFGAEISRSYIVILEQLSPLEAQILDVIYSLPFEKAQHSGIVTADLPNAARIASETNGNSLEPPEDVILAIGNLARLGCLKAGMTYGGGESFLRVNPTVLGKSFVNACRIPKT